MTALDASGSPGPQPGSVLSVGMAPESKISARAKLERALPRVARSLGVAMTDSVDNLDAWAREIRGLVDRSA